MQGRSGAILRGTRKIEGSGLCGGAPVVTPTDDDRVAHILDAIERINRWTAEHQHDDIYRSAVMRQMEIIGEAATRLSDTFKSVHPAVFWRDIAGFRVQVSHRYWDTEWSTVEQTIVEDLPILRDAFTSLGEYRGEGQVEIETPTDEPVHPRPRGGRRP